ncbi:MAG: hypothetical protein GF334_08285 [Candidatus Altiarchaeales archaeon]|nr:hypothetical protein [Candidatus Altiarchaeales archaeon]
MAITKEIENLARQVSLGDEEALRELIRLGIRQGYVQLIGKPGYAVRRPDTGEWLRQGWWRDDERPHFYMTEGVAARYAKEASPQYGSRSRGGVQGVIPTEVVESAHIILKNTKVT